MCVTKCRKLWKQRRSFLFDLRICWPGVAPVSSAPWHPLTVPVYYYREINLDLYQTWYGFTSAKVKNKKGVRYFHGGTRSSKTNHESRCLKLFWASAYYVVRTLTRPRQYFDLLQLSTAVTQASKVLHIFG